MRIVKVRYARRASRDILSIMSFIAQHGNPQTAIDVATRIFVACDMLGQFPKLGHLGPVKQTREWVVPGLPYIVVHRLREQEAEVIILAIRHGAENRGEATYDP